MQVERQEQVKVQEYMDKSHVYVWLWFKGGERVMQVEREEQVKVKEYMDNWHV